MSPVTATPADTGTRPKVPDLDRSRAPRELELLGDPWASLGEESRRLFAAAVKARSAYDSTGKLLDEARAKDRDALAEAARSGKDDPGRVHEMAALVEIESAYNGALGATDAANSAIRAVRAAIVGDEGVKAHEALEARIAKAQKTLAKHADQVAADIDEITSLAAIVELLIHTRKGKGYSTIKTATPRRAEVAHRGRAVDVGLLMEQIQDFEPRIEA